MKTEENKKILIIDDSKLAHKIVTELLIPHAWEVRSVYDTKQAMQTFASEHFPIILLDIVLPDQDGLEFLSTIKNHVVDSLTIVISAHPSIEKAIKAIKLGAYDFITKPFNNDEFIHTIENAFAYWKSQQDKSVLLSMLKNKVSELENAMLQTKKEKSRTYALLRSMSEGALLMNEHGKITLINRKAAEIINISLDDENKINYGSIHLRTIMAKMKEVQKTQQLSSLQIKVGDKKPSYYNVQIIPLQHDNSIEILALLSDITELIKIYEMRSDFISRLSHELRTPLTNIKNSQHLMKKIMNPMSDQITKYFDIMEKETEHLQMHVNDLLSYADYSSRKTELELAENNLHEIMKKEIEFITAEFNSKKINIAVKMPSEAITFIFDEQKISKVIKNLLNNAFSFTPEEGSVEIGCYIENSYPALKNKFRLPLDLNLKSKFVVVYVKDSGVGIEQQEQSKIFEPFYQSESIQYHHEGTGLGLFISKSIVESHSGVIWFQSAPGKGSTFYFALPFIGANEFESAKVFLKIST
jgi:two-component system, OmpR family, phosphate regulon sensor histidine kinase PhoR